MTRKLYEKCTGCNGTRKLVTQVHIDKTRKVSYNLGVGEDCPLCKDGYVEIGVTVNQLYALMKAKNVAIQPNPATDVQPASD